MAIRFLDPILINQIAAGEVIERPFSVIKELLENSIDAKATELILTLREGGKTYLTVKDNGAGMTANDLNLAVERHATSKIPDNNLFNIQSFGFRGEALAAISSVSRVCVTTRQIGDPGQVTHGYQLKVAGGIKEDIVPVPFNKGTLVEVQDLFFATPARLKFLKSTSSELSSCMDVVERFSLAHPGLHFSVIHNDKTLFNTAKNNLEGLEARLNYVLGEDFSKSSIKIDHISEDVRVHGYIAVPTYHASQSTKQYIFVNQRPVKDKLLQTAMRVAYQDFLPKDRHPVCCLFIDVDPMLVDMNVHPAKAEVRFIQAAGLRSLIISLIHNALKENGPKTSVHLASAAVEAFSPRPQDGARSSIIPFSSPFPKYEGAQRGGERGSFGNLALQVEPIRCSEQHYTTPNSLVEQKIEPGRLPDVLEHYPLGNACAQLFESYIISQTNDTFFLIDQHAAAERILYEQLKEKYFSKTLSSQSLLIPEIIDLSPIDRDLLLSHQETLQTFGVIIESFGVSQLMVRQVPALFEHLPLKPILLDMLEDLKAEDISTALLERLLLRLSSKACHGSVRFGRKLDISEMNALLREIENNPGTSQCNHGRPTFIKLSKKDIEKLFERA